MDYAEGRWSAASWIPLLPTGDVSLAPLPPAPRESLTSRTLDAKRAVLVENTPRNAVVVQVRLSVGEAVAVRLGDRTRNINDNDPVVTGSRHLGALAGGRQPRRPLRIADIRPREAVLPNVFRAGLIRRVVQLHSDDEANPRARARRPGSFRVYPT